jgi:hypothetical protein
MAHSRHDARSPGHDSSQRYYRPNVFQAVVDRRAEAAAVNAMASGSQQKTIEAYQPPGGAFAVGVEPEELGHVE